MGIIHIWKENYNAVNSSSIFAYYQHLIVADL